VGARLLRRFRAPLSFGKPLVRGWRAGLYRLLLRTPQDEKPFFELLRSMLDQGREVTLGELLEAAGEQTYGLLILLLAMPSLVPGLNVGAAPVGGLGIMALGLQMSVGVPHPWVPAKVQAQVLHQGKVKHALARLEETLDRFRLKDSKRQHLNRVWTGLVIAWLGFLLAIPVPLPFGNIAPAAVLLLMGAALLEERPSWAWLAALGALGITIYFGLSFDLIVVTVRRFLPQ
jgi:hypothetical protein